MKRWQDFLDSLSTRGGNILLLILATVGLVFAYFHAIHHQMDAGSIQTVQNLLSGFAGALLALLAAQACRQQMQDRVDTATSSLAPKTSVANAQTVNVDQSPKDAAASETPKP